MSLWIYEPQERLLALIRQSKVNPLHLRKLFSDLGETFWLLPAILVLAGVALAVAMVELDRSGLVPIWLIDSPWLYNGGGTGARTLLGAVASSTIGVAGTVFSITIASLSLAAGQMGPRLLRNFVRDRGNQITLGAFLATFSCALMVLRSVRTHAEGTFVPHLALSVGILLAFVCVGMLVYFVGHMAGRINVDTVIDLVSDDVHGAIYRLTLETPPAAKPPMILGTHAVCVTDDRHGYLQHLDAEALADWASCRSTAIKLLVRPGQFVFPGAAIAVIADPAEGIEAAIRDATALSHQRFSDADLEFAIRQLIEVAVRALSPGINDPHTAMSVLDRLGSALCEIAPRYLDDCTLTRDGKTVLTLPAIDYDGLVDAMFNMIRQNAAGSPAILIHMLEVLTAVVGIERKSERISVLTRHADLVLSDGQRTIETPADFDDLRRRYGKFEALCVEGSIDLASAKVGAYSRRTTL